AGDPLARMRYSVVGVPMLDQPFGYLLSFLTDWAQTCQLAILLLMRSIEVGPLYPTCGVSNVIFCPGAAVIQCRLGLDLYGGTIFALLYLCGACRFGTIN